MNINGTSNNSSNVQYREWQQNYTALTTMIGVLYSTNSKSSNEHNDSTINGSSNTHTSSSKDNMQQNNYTGGAQQLYITQPK